MDNDTDISENCQHNNHDECDGTLEPSYVADCECGCHDPNHKLNQVD